MYFGIFWGSLFVDLPLPFRISYSTGDLQPGVGLGIFSKVSPYPGDIPGLYRSYMGCFSRATWLHVRSFDEN